ncbi:MAG: hypothetical protein ACLRJV_14480 [Eubacteriales bacterium]
MKSWQRLWDAVQQSRQFTFERYVIAMDILRSATQPAVFSAGSSMAVLKNFGTRFIRADFRQLPDFGETLHNNIHEWFCNEENFVFGRNYR